MHTSLFLSIALAASVGLFACSSASSNTGTADGGGDSGGATTSTSDGGTSDGGTSGSGATCNTLTQQASNVDVISSTARLPTATGGTIADGTYVMTGATFYSAETPNGTTVFSAGKVTIQISGSMLQSVISDPKGGDSRSTSKIAVSGTELTINDTCPPEADAGPNGTTTTFTATSTTLTTFTNSGGTGTVGNTFTKR